MESVTKAEVKDEFIEEKQTTKQILKSLDSCLGITTRTKQVIQMYADYIKLYKKDKIKIGNLNMILYCNNSNYTNVVNIINNLLYKEGITTLSSYQLLGETYISSRSIKAKDNELYVIDNDNLRDYKINKFRRVFFVAA